MPVVCERFDNLGLSDPNRSFRLGILGGTFDPVHVGHLACAEQAREAFGLDGVVFIPTARSVFKLDQEVSEAHHRYEMCRLATRSNPAFDVSGLEIERGGETYTIDTLRALRAHYPANVELFFIAGADAVASIAQWKDYHDLDKLARFVGVTRPGFEFSDQLHDVCALGRYHVQVEYLEVTALAVSSSSIRNRVRQGHSVRYLVPDEVNEYLTAHALYRVDKEHTYGPS